MFWQLFNRQGYSEQEISTQQQHPDTLRLSKSEMFLASCNNILRNDYGFLRACDTGISVNSRGEYIPLYTYPAIEYIDQFDFTKKTIFEFGSGASTLYWMKRAKWVYSAENNNDWFERIQGQLDSNVTMKLAQEDEFPQSIKTFDKKFDVIVIDGFGYRYDCAKLALQYLNKGGMIILDNADWHYNTAALLKNAGLLQVDMTGFKPTEHHTSTTSIFFDRTFDFPTLQPRQPIHGMGARAIHSKGWDEPQAKQAK